MINNHLITSDSGVNGIYRCKVIAGADSTDIRVYIPGVSSISPFNLDGSLNLDIYNNHKSSFPKVQWCCYNIESKELQNQDSLNWCMFENGDFRKPVVISYAVIGPANDVGGSSSGGSYTAPTNNGAGAQASDTSAGNETPVVVDTDVNASAIAQNAVNLAVIIANDNKHGYVWGGKGPTNFDCSGFIWYCYNNTNGGGISLSYAATGSMKSMYTAAGFTDVTNKVNLHTGEGLVAGDILLSVGGGHVDMYAGNGKRVGAHSPKSGIYVDNYGYNQSGYNNKYDCVLRYGG